MNEYNLLCIMVYLYPPAVQNIGLIETQESRQVSSICPLSKGFAWRAFMTPPNPKPPKGKKKLPNYQGRNLEKEHRMGDIVRGVS